MSAPDEPGTGPVIRDNRRIDPATGQARRGKHAATGTAGTSSAGRAGGAGGGQHRKGNGSRDKDKDTAASSKNKDSGTSAEAAAPAASSAELEQVRTQLAERTADMQRLQAEYANYRKRVERDRATVRELATASTLSELLPILDAIGQAREHGELSGGFKSVADSLQAAVGKLGLVTYGERGDEFDPKIHEALTSTVSADVTQETCVEILQPGYRVGERVLRPARVAVAEPDTGSDEGSDA
ncbi:MAG TPA: nucleotide exchange factor GrpE [Trebonia sp.]|jgi:molecular chaperone GrpE